MTGSKSSLNGGSDQNPVLARKQAFIFEIVMIKLLEYWEKDGLLTVYQVMDVARRWWMTADGVSVTVTALGDGWLEYTIYGRTMEIQYTELNKAIEERQGEARMIVEHILGFSPWTRGTASESTPTSPAPSSSSTSRDLSGRASGLGSSYVLLREIPGFY